MTRQQRDQPLNQSPHIIFYPFQFIHSHTLSPCISCQIAILKPFHTKISVPVIRQNTLKALVLQKYTPRGLKFTTLNDIIIHSDWTMRLRRLFTYAEK